MPSPDDYIRVTCIIPCNPPAPVGGVRCPISIVEGGVLHTTAIITCGIRDGLRLRCLPISRNRCNQGIRFYGVHSKVMTIFRTNIPSIILCCRIHIINSSVVPDWHRIQVPRSCSCSSSIDYNGRPCCSIPVFLR